MLPEIRCTISENDKILESVTQAADFANLSECLTKFELELNTTLTKLITDAGNLSADSNLDEENDVSNDEDQEAQISPKKQKKN